MRSVVRRGLRSRALLHLLVVVAFAAAAGAVSGSAALAVVTAGVVVVALVVSWWVRASRDLRWGLDTGQSVSLGYAASGELTVLDVTGRIWMPRGSAVRVLPLQPLTAVVGRDVVFALPASLVEDDDVAFLEGRDGASAGERTEPALPRLRHSRQVDVHVQEDLVRAWTRRALTTADVLLWALLGLLFLAVAVLTLVQGSGGVAAFYGLVGLVTAAGSLPFLRRGQAAVRARYPVGSVLRAEVAKHGLTLGGTHTTVWTPWEMYRGHRLDDRTLQLRRVDRAHGGVQTVPTSLLPASVLKQVVQRVPQGF